MNTSDSDAFDILCDNNVVDFILKASPQELECGLTVLNATNESSPALNYIMENFEFSEEFLSSASSQESESDQTCLNVTEKTAPTLQNPEASFVCEKDNTTSQSTERRHSEKRSRMKPPGKGKVAAKTTKELLYIAPDDQVRTTNVHKYSKHKIKARPKFPHGYKKGQKVPNA